jgi:hypothetical protein
MFPHILEHLLYAITPIREAERNQNIILFQSSQTLYLVTAKHVLLDLKKFIIEFHKSDRFNIQNITVQNHTLLVPDDTTDVCVVKLDDASFNGLKYAYFGNEQLMTDDQLLETFTVLPCLGIQLDYTMISFSNL